MLQRLILCVLLCVAACSPRTHQTRMDRLTSSVEIGQFFLNAAENDPHIGTYTTNDAIVRNLLGTIHHSGPFAIPLAIAHDMYTNRHPPGDLIVAIKDQPIRNAQEFTETMQRYQPGDRVPFKVLRQNKLLEITVALEEEPL